MPRAAAAAGTLTLLKLIAGVLYPTGGWLHTPAHLRTVLVHEAQILKDTLWNNLTVGVAAVRQPPPDSPQFDAWRKHVWAIAEALGLSKSLIGNDNVRVGEGGGVLRLVDRQVVSLARAFIADPQLLLLNKPTAIFEQTMRDNFFKLLSQWTQRKGIFARGIDGLLDSSPDAPDEAEPLSSARAAAHGRVATFSDFRVRLINREVNLMPRDCIFSTAEHVEPPQETTHLATFEPVQNQVSGEVQQVRCRVTKRPEASTST